MKLLNDITTGRDNRTHDIARVVMVVNAGMLAVVLVLGVSFYLYGYIVSRPFDAQTLFTSVLTYVGGVSALLSSGAAAIFFKRSTEPSVDGSPAPEATPTPPVTSVNVTNVS